MEKVNSPSVLDAATRYLLQEDIHAHTTNSNVLQATVIMQRLYPAACLIYEYPTIFVDGRKKRADIAAFDDNHSLIAIVEVGFLNNGPKRLQEFQDAYPAVRVIWLPFSDLYPEYDHFRVSGSVICVTQKDVQNTAYIQGRRQAEKYRQLKHWGRQ